tara:strand:- start:14064 stop:16310 length:2247 start_codon:yes stop_codon:yes gene_type:complete
MAKTFYGYAEREAGSNVDWSQIGSEISEMLNQEITRRVDLKNDIDTASREYGEVLANAPTGQHKGATDFITDLTGNAMQARLVQDRLLKSGQLKVKDYLLMRENLKSGTQQVFDVAKTFQAEYARKTERMTKNESAAYEKKLFELTEGFSNFNNSGAYINPTNYQVSLAKKEKVETADGGVIYKMSKNPSEFFTVTELNNFASADVDRFDIAGAVSKIASEIGERVNQTYSMDPSKRSFIIQAISDPTGDVYEKMLRDGDLTKDDMDVVIKFREQIKAEIGAITGNELNALSVYTDSMVGFKDFTFNEDEQGDGMVLLEKDPAGGLPMPNFKNKKGEELLIDIEKNILNRIKVRLDQSVTATGTQIREASKTAQTSDEFKRDKVKNKVNTAKDIFLYDLVYGNKEQKDKALDGLRSYNNENILKYEFKLDNEGKQNLYAKVPADNADGFTMVEMIRDFNNLSPEEVARQIIFNQRANILDEKDKEYYTASMAMTGFGIDAAKKYKLNDNVVRPIMPGEVVESGETRGRYIDLAAREAATQQGAVIAGNTVFNKAHKNTSSAADAANAISTAYQAKPEGGRLAQNPLNPDNMKVTPINKENSAKIHDDNTAWFGKNNSQLIEISLDPSVGPSFVIPIYDSSYGSKSAIPEIMSFLDQKIIDQFRQGKDYKPFTLDDIKQFMGTYSGSKDYFDEFQRGYKAMLDKGGSPIINGPLGTGMSSDKGGDDVGGDEPGAADDTNANPGNTLFQK